MACFLVSAAETVVVTALEKKAKQEEAKKAVANFENPDQVAQEEVPKIPLSKKLHWLSRMLWGGVFLLAFEHIWHGEVALWPPFLTAMASPGETAQMLQEMATVGVSMALLITAIWGGIVVVADQIVKRKVLQTKTNQG